MLPQGGVFMGRSHCAACLDDCVGSVSPHWCFDFCVISAGTQGLICWKRVI